MGTIDGYLYRILFYVGLLVAVYITVCLTHWVMCRISAKRCPNCRSKWYTELVGEWQGEEWVCRRCRHWWIAG